MQVQVLRLAPGEDLRAALEAQEIAAGCILSAVGSFSRVVLRYAQRTEGSAIEGPTELLTLSGTLGRDGVHLHASVSDADGRVKGGHVMPGCIVRTTAEIVIALLPQWELGRAFDPATGFKELQARRLP
ncbi:PPC domain-containing DNA-binding protein [Ramlibacter tataouinensis]|uniref:PPC domain-containing DNA-binding protein n=1 Tax=Ramlibacter tataouinensis TaxID=94132 RepID=UPI0007775F32